MFLKYGLPILAIFGVSFAAFTVVRARQTPPPSVPMVSPPVRFDTVRSIAGAGIVEAKRENIPIGVNVPGVVTELYVKKGDHVSAGDPLFRVDDRNLKAALAVQTAMVASAQAQYHKLKAAPRPEDVPPAEAAVEEARARLNDAEVAMVRTERLFNRQMAAAGDFDKDKFAYYAAKATLAKVVAECERIKRGTWKEDLAVAQANIDLAQAQLESTKVDLERLTVKAPMDGDVLQLNVRLGQLATISWKEPMIVLGDRKELHVRVDIDENDLPWFDKNAQAIATLKGRPQVRFPIELVYVEPYVIPKQSLTGTNSERVDTRVLQVVYRLPMEHSVEFYVGEQMDVYLKAAKEPVGVKLDNDSKTVMPFEDEPADAPKSKADTPKG